MMALQKRRTKEKPKRHVRQHKREYVVYDERPGQARPCVNKDGTTKRSYATSAMAKSFAKATSLRTPQGPDDPPIRAYHCPACGLYHVGHDRRARM